MIYSTAPIAPISSYMLLVREDREAMNSIHIIYDDYEIQENSVMLLNKGKVSAIMYDDLEVLSALLVVDAKGEE